MLSGWGAAAGEQARLSSEFAAALKRGGNLSMAEIFYRHADQLEANAAWAKEVADAHRELRRREANQRRRPVVTENIEQDRIVLPMLAQGGAN